MNQAHQTKTLFSEMAYYETEHDDEEMMSYQSKEDTPDTVYGEQLNANDEDAIMQEEHPEMIEFPQNNQNSALAPISINDNLHESTSHVLEYAQTKNPQEYGDEAAEAEEIDYSQVSYTNTKEADGVLAPRFANPVNSTKYVKHYFKRVRNNPKSNLYSLDETDEDGRDYEETEDFDEAEVAETHEMERKLPAKVTNSMFSVIQNKEKEREVFEEPTSITDQDILNMEIDEDSQRMIPSKYNKRNDSKYPSGPSIQSKSNAQKGKDNNGPQAEKNISAPKGSMFGFLKQQSKQGGITKGTTSKEKHQDQQPDVSSLLPHFNKAALRYQLFRETDQEQSEFDEVHAAKLSASIFHGDINVEPLDIAKYLMNIMLEIDPTIGMMMLTDKNNRGTTLKPKNLQSKNFQFHVQTRKLDRRTKLDIVIKTRVPRLGMYLYAWLSQGKGSKHNIKTVMNCRDLQTRELGIIIKANTRTHNLDTLKEAVENITGTEVGLFEREEWLMNSNRSPTVVTVIAVETNKNEYPKALPRLSKCKNFGFHYSNLMFVPHTMAKSKSNEYRKLIFSHLNYLKNEETVIIPIDSNEQGYELLTESMEQATYAMDDMIEQGDIFPNHITLSGHKCYVKDFLKTAHRIANRMGIAIQPRRIYQAKPNTSVGAQAVKSNEKAHSAPKPQEATQKKSDDGATRKKAVASTVAKPQPDQCQKRSESQQQKGTQRLGHQASKSKKLSSANENALTQMSKTTLTKEQEATLKQHYKNKYSGRPEKIQTTYHTKQLKEQSQTKDRKSAVPRNSSRPPLPQDALKGGRGRGRSRIQAWINTNAKNSQEPQTPTSIVPLQQTQVTTQKISTTEPPSQMARHGIDEGRVKELIKENNEGIFGRLDTVEDAIIDLRNEHKDFRAVMTEQMGDFKTIGEEIKQKSDFATQLSLQLKDEVAVTQKEDIDYIKLQLKNALTRENRHYKDIAENMQQNRKDILSDNKNNADRLLQFVSNIYHASENPKRNEATSRETSMITPAKTRVEKKTSFDITAEPLYLTDDLTVDTFEERSPFTQQGITTSKSPKPMRKTMVKTPATVATNNRNQTSRLFSPKTSTKRRIFYESDDDDESEDEEDITRKINQAMKDKHDKESSVGQAEREALKEDRRLKLTQLSDSVRKRKLKATTGTPTKKGKNNTKRQEFAGVSCKILRKSPIQTRRQTGTIQPPNYSVMGNVRKQKTTNTKVSSVKSPLKMRSIKKMFSPKSKERNVPSHQETSESSISLSNPTFEEGKDGK